jgi:hypothetical protein
MAQPLKQAGIDLGAEHRPAQPPALGPQTVVVGRGLLRPLDELAELADLLLQLARRGLVDRHGLTC